MQDQSAKTLKSDVVGLLGAATLGVVMLSPAMTLYGGFGPTFLAGGGVATLALGWGRFAPFSLGITSLYVVRALPLFGCTGIRVHVPAHSPGAVSGGY